MSDERALQPLELVRILAEIRDLPEVKEQKLPVLGWLENTASSPQEVVAAYSEALHATPLEMDAADYGWISRRRLFWIEGLRSDSEVRLPGGYSIKKAKDRLLITYTGTKPVPQRVHFEAGYAPGIDAVANMANEGAACTPL